MPLGVSTSPPSELLTYQILCSLWVELFLPAGLIFCPLVLCIYLSVCECRYVCISTEQYMHCLTSLGPVFSSIWFLHTKKRGDLKTNKSFWGWWEKSYMSRKVLGRRGWNAISSSFVPLTLKLRSTWLPSPYKPIFHCPRSSAQATCPIPAYFLDLPQEAAGCWCKLMSISQHKASGWDYEVIY